MPRENLIIKTRNLCSGNRSQLPESSQNSECHIKTKQYFLERHISYNEVYLVIMNFWSYALP